MEHGLNAESLVPPSGPLSLWERAGVRANRVPASTPSPSLSPVGRGAMLHEKKPHTTKNRAAPVRKRPNHVRHETRTSSCNGFNPSRLMNADFPVRPLDDSLTVAARCGGYWHFLLAFPSGPLSLWERVGVKATRTPASAPSPSLFPAGKRCHAGDFVDANVAVDTLAVAYLCLFHL